MEITQTDAGPQTLVLKLAGKVMMGSDSERIAAIVDESIAAGKRVIIFDLSEVTRMDSTGVGRFIYAFNKTAAVGGRILMAGATWHIFNIFHVSLLDTMIPFFATLEEAQAATA